MAEIFRGRDFVGLILGGCQQGVVGTEARPLKERGSERKFEGDFSAEIVATFLKRESIPLGEGRFSCFF